MTGNRVVNAIQTYIPSQVGVGISWLATGIVAFPCLFLGLVLGHVLEPFGVMFQGVGVELPWPTRFLLATHGWPLRLVFFTLAVIAIWKEFSVRELSRRFVLTARMFFAAFVTVTLAMLVLYLPLFILINRLAGAK